MKTWEKAFFLPSPMVWTFLGHVHPKLRHQHLLTGGVLIGGTDANVAYFHMFLLKYVEIHPKMGKVPFSGWIFGVKPYTSIFVILHFHAFPNRVGLSCCTCQNAKTDSIGILFCCVIWVYPIGSEFFAVEERFDLVGCHSFG